MNLQTLYAQSFCRLIRNITIFCNYHAQFYKSSVHGHFHFDWLRLEILSLVNTLYNFTNPKLQVLQMHGYFRFCRLIWSIAISSRCRPHLYKSYMHGHFYFCRLIGNITISSNCRALLYKPYMHGYFYFYCLIENIAVCSNCPAQFYNTYVHG